VAQREFRQLYPPGRRSPRPGPGPAAAQAWQPQWEPPRLAPSAREMAQIECKGRGTATVLSVERLLRRTGMLKALGRARWIP